MGVNCVRSFDLRLVCLVLFAVVFKAGIANAQGILGRRFVSVSYDAALQSSNPLNVDWTHGMTVATNFPLNETWDILSSLQFEWASGQLPAGPTTAPVNFDLGVFETSITKHFSPNRRFDPFARIGVGYAQATAEIELGGALVAQDTVDDTGLFWAAGFQLELTDHSSIVTQIGSGDSLEEFDLDELAYRNVHFESMFVRWWNDRWLSGFAIGSDFDDVDIGLRGFLGFGW